MSSRTVFKRMYSPENIKVYYFRKEKYRAIPGIDRLTRDNFENKLGYYIDLISSKVQNGTYKFIPYKERLILKGRDKNPRVISIPSIRDRVALGVLNEFICSCFRDFLNNVLIHCIIAEIKNEIASNIYDYYIKIDIKKFYSSINHDLLLKRLRRKIRYQLVLDLISKAIKTSTQSDRSKANRDINTTGVPEGLSISNALANVYLYNLDQKYRKRNDLKYFRYVDDTLILCTENKAQEIKLELYKEIKRKYKLNINLEKEDEGRLDSKGFNYLGYYIKDNVFSVRESSKVKMEHSLEIMFSDFVKTKVDEKNIDFFVWKLNLKITGCIDHRKKYGWVFFFSQIDDNSILFHFDWLIHRYIERFRLAEELSIYRIKRFVRAYFEITKNIHETNYIPNFDNYDIENKTQILQEIYKVKVSGLRNDQIEILFNKFLYNVIKDLEKDMQDFS